jgi:hypothetical protein
LKPGARLFIHNFAKTVWDGKVIVARIAYLFPVGRCGGREVYVMSMVSKRVWLVGLSSALCLALCAGLTRAQDDAKRPAASSGKEEVKGRLPIYFGQIGLSRKQEDDVRKAAQPFDEKIVALRKQIADLDKQIDDLDAEKVAACEKMLTDGQKSALVARRQQAEADKAARKKKTANGESPKPEETKP